MFKKSRIICVSECHFSREQVEIKKIILKYYEVDQFAKKLSKPIDVVCFSGLSYNKSASVYKLNE